MEQLNNNDLLAELNQQFGDDGVASAKTRSNEKIPAGEVRMWVENAFFNRTTNNNKRLVAVCKVVRHSLGSDWNGRTYFKNWMIETAENISWLKGDIKNLSIPAITSNADLVALPSALTGIVFDATLKDNKNPEFQADMYIGEGAFVSKSTEDELTKFEVDNF